MQTYLWRISSPTMKQAKYPILEFDKDRKSITTPLGLIKPKKVPEHCIICFFPDVIKHLHTKGKAKIIASLSLQNPVYEININGKPLAIYLSGVGAPLAVGFMEEAIALGCKKFIALGSAGVLDKNIACHEIVIPHSAIRDEGTSYHYLPPSREVKAHPAGLTAIETVLKKYHCKYTLAKTWTMDAFYRETPAKIKLRKSEGCLTVEMEAAALFAVAQFRKVIFGQILMAADDISGCEWDHRNWFKNTSPREKMFWLAAEACVSL
jgi:uridine phosphorylase